MPIREYRSNMFSMLLKEKRYALEVYNALNDTNYENEDDVEIFCLENGISLSVRNDASFVLDNYLSIYEQQSTINPNMPLRSLIYAVNLIKEILNTNNSDLFGKKLIHIPNPRFVVFYNGNEAFPEVSELKLSSSYINPEEDPKLELKCTVYNINPNNNNGLKEKSSMLAQYVEFVETVKSYGPFGNDKEKLKDALATVIKEFIRDNKLREFLQEHGDEVIEVETLDYTFERREELIQKNAFEDGKAAGIYIGRSEGITIGQENGQFSTVVSLYYKNRITIDEAAEELSLTVKEFENKLHLYKNEIVTPIG